MEGPLASLDGVKLFFFVSAEERKVPAQAIVNNNSHRPAIYLTAVLFFADDFRSYRLIFRVLKNKKYLPTKSLEPRMVVMNSSSEVTLASPKSEIFRLALTSFDSISKLSG